MGMEQEVREGMPISRIESIRGFLVYLSSTYRDMNPYVKGVILTLYIWRLYRDE